MGRRARGGARKRVPTRRIGFLLLFLALQGVGICGYLRYENLIANITLTTLRESYLPALTRAPDGVNDTRSTGPAKAVPVLLYHGVVEDPDGSNVLIQDFREQMFALKRAGYEGISMADYLAFVRGERTLPTRSFLLTFDDGRKDSYYPVDPIIRALGYHATMFVITGQSLTRERSARDHYLNKDELVTMARSGRWDIEAHTRNSHDLTDVDETGVKGHFLSNYRWLPDRRRPETEQEFRSRVVADMRGARADLERELGTRVRAFAFPFGDYGQQTLNNPTARDVLLAASREIFEASFVQDRVGGDAVSQNRPGQDLATMRRLEVYPDWTPENLLAMMEFGLPKTLPFQDDFSDFRGWQTEYGDMRYSGDNMMISAAETGTSASARLAGTELWADYTYTVAFEPVDPRTTVTLVSRYQQDQAHISCSMTGDRLRVERRLGAETRVLAETRIPAAVRMETMSLSMTVREEMATCSGPATVTAGSAQPPETGLSRGGIGMKIWNPTKGGATLIVRRVDVTWD